MKVINDIIEKYPSLADKLKDIKPMSNEEYQEQQCKWYNESEGNLNKSDGIECPICKNKGYIQVVIDGYVKVKNCECMKRRQMIIQAKNSGLGEYLNKRAKDYIANEDWQKQNYALMVEYCKNNPNEWFIACGQSGSGKTLICSIIANHLLYNLSKNVKYITWTDFISQLKRDMMGDGTERVSDYLEEIKNIEVLFIDELLKKYNETDLKYIIEIINYRYSNNLKTIITSERLINDLLDIDEATFGRVIEKCGKFVIEVPKDRSKNYRLRNIKR